MDLSHWLAGGALLGVVTACWTKIKEFCWRILNLFIQQIEIHDDNAQGALIDYLVAHYRRSVTYDKIYGAANEHTKDGKFGLIPYELLGKRGIIFWNGWLPFLYSGGPRPNQGNQNNNNNTPQERVVCTLTSIRGTLNVEKLLREACAQRNASTWDVDYAHDQRQRRFFIRHVPALPSGSEEGEEAEGSAGLAWYQLNRYRLIAHSPDQLGKQLTTRKSPLEDLIFPKRVKTLIQEILMWRNSKEWYRERGIPWKRGWLCYGPPGTGKTALARAFAEELDMPLHVYNLAEMGNFELMKAWAEMQSNVPCVALIEDIDNIFHGRKNVVRSRLGASLLFSRKKRKGNNNNNSDDEGGRSLGMLSFDCLLNVLDGVERSDGVFTIITTNDVSKVDPALGQPRTLPDGTTEFISTRPGRIDKAIELGYMEAQDKKLMAHRILGEFEEEYLKMVAFIDRFPDFQETPAQFQERCAQVALARFWQESQRQQQERQLAHHETPRPGELTVS
jgi:ATPase family associated with various cellular activities (AAA)